LFSLNLAVDNMRAGDFFRVHCRPQNKPQATVADMQLPTPTCPPIVRLRLPPRPARLGVASDRLPPRLDPALVRLDIGRCEYDGED
jgi:hypothetical protein